MEMKRHESGDVLELSWLHKDQELHYYGQGLIHPRYIRLTRLEGQDDKQWEQRITEAIKKEHYIRGIHAGHPTKGVASPLTIKLNGEIIEE
jgi:hypothetical protein